MASRFVFFIAALLMCYASFFFYPRWKHSGTEAAISWDVSGYYWYLPSVFIYKDLKHQAFKDSIISKYRPSNTAFSGIKCENGNYVMKYSSGMAVMYFPFFIAAHMLARPLGYPADGFSAPYQFAIQFGGLLISIIGLWYFRKLLLNFYADKVVAIVLALLVLGSNYLNYATIDGGMSHCWLFTVYVFLLLNTHYFYQAFKIKYAVRIGLLIGLATLTRPTDILSCIIPLLWGLDNISYGAVRTRVDLFMKNYKALLIAAVCAACVISIQLIYWKYASGHWLFYSYQDQKLYFRSPNFLDYTFSYRSGWLTYAPALILAFIGIIPFLKGGKNKVVILVFFLLNYYIICAWSIWWYGGRAMIQSYPVLFFPVAELVKVCLSRRASSVVFAAIAGVLIYYNIWLTYQYHNEGLYLNDSMTKAYFWRVVGRWQVPANVILLADDPELYEASPNNKTLIYQDNFVNDTGIQFRLDTQTGGKTLVLNKEWQNSPLYKVAGNNISGQWLRAEATFGCDQKEWENWKMAQFILRLVDKGVIVKENMVRVYRSLGDGETKKITVDMKLPKQKFDSVNILFWNGGSERPIYIDSLKLWSFNE